MTVRDYVAKLLLFDQDAPVAVSGGDGDWLEAVEPNVSTMHDCGGYYLYCAGRGCGLCVNSMRTPLVDVIKLN